MPKVNGGKNPELSERQAITNAAEGNGEGSNAKQLPFGYTNKRTYPCSKLFALMACHNALIIASGSTGDSPKDNIDSLNRLRCKSSPNIFEPLGVG